MKQIVVVSGKGGTGKTVLTASLAALAGVALQTRLTTPKRCFDPIKFPVLVDCDVDAADLHILLHPRIRERHEFRGGKRAFIDRNRCTKCRQCLEHCRFGAIGSDYTVDAVACEGCGLCSRLCPSGAVQLRDTRSGEWYVSDTKYGTLVHARLFAAEENSGKLVTTIKETAKKIVEVQGAGYLIVDGPPGIGCPVFASLSGADLALVVTEPTLSGIHDMERVMEVAAHFKIDTAVVINKYDINGDNCTAIEALCAKRKSVAIGRIPFSHRVSESIVQMVPYVEFRDDEVTQEIKSLWEKIETEVT